LNNRNLIHPPIINTIYSFQIICSIHVKDKATMDSLYWDTVKQIYGTHGMRISLIADSE
jgi:hypothetical protein